MFGKNPLRKQDLGHPDALRVKAIFHTIQGEGPNAGHPAIFIRLGGCNLACSFCDTDFETDLAVMTVDAIIAEVTSYPNVHLVVVTGGEPMIQDIFPLCAALSQDYDYRVQIETAGTVWVPGINDVAEIVCSPKTGAVHQSIQLHAGAWKYIIRAGEQSLDDGLPAFSTQTPGRPNVLARPFADDSAIYVQPMDEGDVALNAANQAAAVAACLKYGYLLSLQQHKIIGVE